jgi:hypothetical protein
MQKFFNFGHTKGVSQVFVDGPGLTGNAAVLGAFTFAAAKECMTIELLYGASSWALTANHSIPVGYAQKAAAAVAGMAVKPTQLHYDIEPYTLAQWSSDMNGTANQYLDLLEKLAPIAHGAGMGLTVDIPFWYDSKLITRGGVTRPLNEWIQDRADRVVLMDYRDTGSAMVTEAGKEIAYGTKIGRKVVLGAETMCGLSPTLITFCEEGNAALNTALTQVQSAFTSQAGFGGVAVHHYGSYLTLAP